MLDDKKLPPFAKQHFSLQCTKAAVRLKCLTAENLLKPALSSFNLLAP